MQLSLAVLPGDGIGPDVTAEAVKVLEAVGSRFGHDFRLDYGLVGGVAIDKTGSYRRYVEDVSERSGGAARGGR